MDNNDTQLYTEAEKIATGIIVYILDIFMIIGNILVMVAFLNDRQLQVTRNYYIFNLALADLIIGVFVIPFYSSTIWMNDWVLSRPFCVIWITVNQTALVNSHAAIFLVTWDRYEYYMYLYSGCTAQIGLGCQKAVIVLKSYRPQTSRKLKA